MSRFSLCLVEHKPLHAVPVFARHIGVMPLSQPPSEFELKEIQHRSSFCSTFLPPRHPFFFFFFPAIQVFPMLSLMFHFSVPRKHLFRAHLPPDRWQTPCQGNHFGIQQAPPHLSPRCLCCPHGSSCLTLSDLQLFIHL